MTYYIILTVAMLTVAAGFVWLPEPQSIAFGCMLFPVLIVWAACTVGAVVVELCEE